MRLKKGMQGERESAHYLDHYFKDAENHVVLHDLRFVIEGEVTQIDHLIINRAGSMYLLETKNYACNLVINAHGEFTAEYDNARFGIPSPIEQSLRHERVLCKLLERLDIVGRTQKMPNICHVVMLHPKATIERPSSDTFDTTNVIKAYQFPTWHKRFVDKIGIGTLFKSTLNMRSLETTKVWGENSCGNTALRICLHCLISCSPAHRAKSHHPSRFRLYRMQSGLCYYQNKIMPKFNHQVLLAAGLKNQ